MSTIELLLRLLGIALLILANGFFVAVEFAVIAARRSRIMRLAGQGAGGAVIVARWLRDSDSRDRLVAAAQVGITVASLALGALGESTFSMLLEPPLEPLAEQASGSLRTVLLVLPPLLAVLLFTVLHVVYGEQVPKVMVLDDAESWALRLARPMRLFERLASPFVTVLDALAGLSLRVLGLQAEHAGHRSLYTVEELKDLVSESTKRGVLEPAEREMLHAVFDLGDLRARQVMVPRTEMVSVSADTPLDALVRQAVDTGLSKFPVFDGGADSIAGLVHVKDLLRALAEGRRDARARDLMRDVLFLPESVPVDALLRTMRAEQRRTVVLLDEYGGIAGLVTLEDLLEEIVGDVGDMFGRTEPSIVRLPDGSSRVSGLTQIEVVNEAFGLRLRDPHYDTIAGFVLGRLGRLAEVGDEIETDGLRLRVDALDGRRIAYVRVIPAGEAVEAGSAGNGSQPA